jgi:phytoene synthase
VNTDPSDIAELPTLSRIALGYAPASARPSWHAFFTLDARLASFVRSASEPLTAQLRLAWWRETLGKPATDWPEGEPLLMALKGWNGEHGALTSLVDGWEAMALAEPGLGNPALQLAEGRGKGLAGLASALGDLAHAPEAERLGSEWAIVDIAGKLSDPQERASALTTAKELNWAPARLPRSLRPLAVLHALARKAQARRMTIDELGPSGALAAFRAGFFGR